MTKKDGKKKDIRMAAAYGAVGLIALGAIAVGLANRGSRTPKIDLNATPTPGTVAERTETPSNQTNQTAQNNGNEVTNPTKQTGNNATDNGSTSGLGGQGKDTLAENSGNGNESTGKGTQQTAQNNGTPGGGVPSGEKNGSDKGITTAKGDTPNDAEIPGGQEELPVVNPETVLAGLRFSQETGMLWPVTGNALVSFSPDHVIYNKTLDSYRTTDFVLLSGAVGTQVFAAAEGIVTGISDELWTGKTVTMRVSEDYEIVYGLLSDVAVREGDHVNEGTVFAKIAEPTRYFVEEGSGLYLKVLENGTPVNPMLYLTD